MGEEVELLLPCQKDVPEIYNLSLKKSIFGNFQCVIVSRPGVFRKRQRYVKLSLGLQNVENDDKKGLETIFAPKRHKQKLVCRSVR